ncbi:DUF2285 domain-containing protein [Bradyrhizobium sp. 1.29L]
MWLKDPPAVGVRDVAQLPLDGDFEARALIARRRWRAINGRAARSAFHELPEQKRERFGVAIHAQHAHAAGNTDRAIAELLFGKKRIPDRAWKTHDLRSRTIRLVQTGLALIRGGHRELLRPKR